jgi:hypothetical protein
MDDLKAKVKADDLKKAKRDSEAGTVPQWPEEKEAPVADARIQEAHDKILFCTHPGCENLAHTDNKGLAVCSTCDREFHCCEEHGGAKAARHALGNHRRVHPQKTESETMYCDFSDEEIKNGLEFCKNIVGRHYICIGEDDGNRSHEILGYNSNKKYGPYVECLFINGGSEGPKHLFLADLGRTWKIQPLAREDYAPLVGKTVRLLFDHGALRKGVLLRVDAIDAGFALCTVLATDKIETLYLSGDGKSWEEIKEDTEVEVQ